MNPSQTPRAALTLLTIVACCMKNGLRGCAAVTMISDEAHLARATVQ